MKLLTYYPTDSLLHRINPVVKLVVTVALVILVTFAYDVATPLIFLVLLITLLRLAGGLPLRWIGGSLLPFVAVAGGLFISSALFHRTLSSETELFRIGSLIVSREGVAVGLAIGLRVMFLAASSLLVIGTTEPTTLVVSLVLQGKVNYRLAYATLVGYRFVPLLLGEYRSIRAAARIRGQRGGLRGLLRDAIPLLAGAVRRAGRVALAMDSKAFAAYPTRTFRQPTTMRRADWLFLALMVGGGVALFVALVALGVTHGLGEQFAGLCAIILPASAALASTVWWGRAWQELVVWWPLSSTWVTRLYISSRLLMIKSMMPSMSGCYGRWQAASQRRQRA